MNHRIKNIPEGSRTCAWDGCNERNVQNSKYCYTHKQAAKEAFYKRISDQKAETEQKYKRYEDAVAKAIEAGKTAAKVCKPTPMVVQQHLDLFDDSSPVTETYEPVESGVCGFGYVIVSPGNSSLAIWLKKHMFYFKWYYGGIAMGVKEYGQSYERKMAYAYAYATTLHNELKDILPEDVHIRAFGRLD